MVGKRADMANDPKCAEFVGGTRGHGGYGSRLVKCSWNTTTDEITVDQTKNVLFANEYFAACCEYAPDSLLVTFLKNETVYKVSEGLTKVEPIAPTVGSLNDNKQAIEPMPGFHPTDYPFVLVTGKTETWLVNVNKKKIQTLFTTSGKPFFAQPGVSFHVDAPEVKCVFAHQRLTPRGQL